MVMVDGALVETLHDTGLQCQAIISSKLVQYSQLIDVTIEIFGVSKSASSIKLPIAHINVQSKYVT